VIAAQADPESVRRRRREARAVDRSRKQDDARLLHQAPAEGLDAVGAEVARIGRASAVRPPPFEPVRELPEEHVGQVEIGLQQREIAPDHGIARLERDDGEMLARPRIADRQVVLHALHAG